jgi:hypothetical protein
MKRVRRSWLQLAELGDELSGLPIGGGPKAGRGPLDGPALPVAGEIDGPLPEVEPPVVDSGALPGLLRGVELEQRRDEELRCRRAGSLGRLRWLAGNGSADERRATEDDTEATPDLLHTLRTAGAMPASRR